MDNPSIDIRIPPTYCRYSLGACDQDFTELPFRGAFFIYPSEPEIISSTIEFAIEQLRRKGASQPFTSWRELPIEGQIIFCEICKAVRYCSLIVADVTTLNLNVMFEIGYGLGLGLPVLPIRDTTITKDKKVFDELGILDTFGYHDFQNAGDIFNGVTKRLKARTETVKEYEISRNQPLYFVRSPIDTDGSIKLLSSLKMSALKFRTFDPRETARLSLYEAKKETLKSLGIITYLLDPIREGATVHNARCAFVAGLAMANGKKALLLQEGDYSQPIDYRDVVKTYKDIEHIPKILDPFFKEIIITLQELSPLAKQIPAKALEAVDLGDLAAENEIRQLESYFVPTGQYLEARNGHARLVIGRKGSGKTAIFYRVRDHHRNRKTFFVLDLKSEGYQFTKLREAVLSKLTPGLQAHTMTAFWTFLILQEIAHKIIQDDYFLTYRDPRIKEKYDQVVKAYGDNNGYERSDFSERLLMLIDAITSRQQSIPIKGTPEITALVYTKDIKELQKAIEHYLLQMEEVWLLIDNLDKGWPVKGATSVDIMILRCLLEATRKIQRQLERKRVEFKAVVFIRNDIHEHLLAETADRGKDTVISLDWDDIEFLKEVIKLRLETSTGVEGSFDEIWNVFFDSHIYAEDSFRYMLNRTQMRPREIIRFVRKALEVAINRNHEKVTEEDILHAEIGYSEDSLQDLAFELKDIKPKYGDILYNFLECKSKLSYEEVETLIKESTVSDNEIEELFELLIWFGFLGVASDREKTKYSYQVQYNVRKLDIDKHRTFAVHPAFKKALECKE